MDDVIKMIDLALHANGSYGHIDWQQSMCQCDPDVGMAPCPYCAIFEALTKCKKILQSCRIVLEGVVVLTSDEWTEIVRETRISTITKLMPIFMKADSQLAALEAGKEKP